jgi:WD40 repeat protein
LSLSWHPDSRRLAAGGRHDSAVIWDTRQPRKPIELRAPVNWVRGLAWRPDGSQLATVGNDDVIRLWHTDGRATAQLAAALGGMNALAWSPDGNRLAFTGTPCGLNLWNAPSTNTTHLLTLASKTSFAVAWKPDGRQVAVADGARIIVLDPGTARPLHVLSGHTGNVRSLAWSPDARCLASASEDSLIKLWDAASGRELRTLVGYGAPARAVAWSPDGTRLATGGWDGVVKLWDPELGIELCSFTEHAAQVAAVAFSPDGNCLASSDLDGNIYLRDASPGWTAEQRRLGNLQKTATAELGSHPSTTDNYGDALQPLIWFRDTAERFRHQESDLHSHRLLARFLADNPFAALRDGRRAVELGETAADLSHRNNAAILDDLAAAYAETGDFAKAVAVQTEAIALLNSPVAKAEFTTRLRLYESGAPCRDYDW